MKKERLLWFILLFSATAKAESEISLELAVEAVDKFIKCLELNPKYENGILCGAYFPSYEHIDLSKQCLSGKPIEYYPGITIVYRCKSGVILSADISSEAQKIFVEGVYEVMP